MLANANGNHVVVYAFDNSTGTIDITGRRMTVPHTIAEDDDKTPDGVYGLEFSPNNLNLYYGNLKTNLGRIYHVDLTQTASTLARNQVEGSTDDILNETDHPDGAETYAIGALQLAVNGKIYFAKDYESQLGAIENPDLGMGCTVNHYALPTALNVNNAYNLCRLGLPNMLPNPCKEAPCDCGCAGCNENAEEQNEEAIERAKTKYNVVKSKNSCGGPFAENCEKNAISGKINLEPCFYFHWGDGSNDQIEEHDTEVFYITVCNDFNDIQYNGLRITKITLIPDHPIDKIQIVPDRFINLDCLEPCSCQTREFAMITRADDTAGTYKMEVEYCFESVEITSKPKEGKVEFGFEITED
ncbi:MAG: hypothetical protein IPL65_10505 [Lewinellaceae bacterium]|nr:hypothetical protein [Lewinellaceae bacterium]